MFRWNDVVTVTPTIGSKVYKIEKHGNSYEIIIEKFAGNPSGYYIPLWSLEKVFDRSNL